MTLSVQSQSIRKMYQEMTPYEKNALVNGFYELRNGPDLVNDLAQFHSDFFNFGISDKFDIHFNLPNEPEKQIFFSWHRMQMFEMEQALQEINPDISMPWWDSSIDQSPNSPLFDYDFMGSFNTNWGLRRNLGGNGPLPSVGTITAVQQLEDFLDYSNQVERGATHRGGHVWVGGVMNSPLSPRDPIFYLHHTYVDKLWVDWEKANPGSSSFIINFMIRYDGTYVFDGKTLPLVDPNDILSSKDALGVFYAENGLAELHDYVVSNKTKDVENFYYQYSINVGEGFEVPENKKSIIKSCNEINLQPGFEAVHGSNFIAAIDKTSKTPQLSTFAHTSRKNFFDYDPALQNDHAYDDIVKLADIVNVSVYPNPFKDVVTIELDQQVKVLQVDIVDLFGRSLVTKTMANTSLIRIPEVVSLNSGAYLLSVVADGQQILSKTIIKK